MNSEVVVDRSLIARSSVRTHLALAFGALIVIASAVTGYAVVAVGNLHDAQRRTSDQAVPYLSNLSDAALAAKSAAAGDLTGRVRGRGAMEFQRMASATNGMLTATGQAIATIATTARTLSSSAEQITELSGKLNASADTAAKRAATVSAAAGKASASVQTVAAAGEEMSATIREISNSATIADNIASVAEATEQTCIHSNEAGQVAVSLNRSGADLTNLVAAFRY